MLQRGGVVGGSSAGATILGSYLVRGDTATNTIMMGDHEEGFAFLRDTAIDQHLLRRNRQFDLIEVIEAHPHLLGIGIDEDTAIVVEGDRFEVMGQSYVVIYDHERLLDSGGTVLLPGRGGPVRPRTPAGLPRAAGGPPVRPGCGTDLAGPVRAGTAAGRSSRGRIRRAETDTCRRASAWRRPRGSNALFLPRWVRRVCRRRPDDAAPGGTWGIHIPVRIIVHGFVPRR